MDTYLYIRDKTDQIICMFKYPLPWWLLPFSFTFSKQHAEVLDYIFVFYYYYYYFYLSLYSPQGKNKFQKQLPKETWSWTGVTV